MANNTKVELVNMYSLSETRPKLRRDMISRDQYLDLFDSQFEDERVLCLTGAEGVGVTSTLALFARRHGDNCASYFNNGWSRYLLNSRTIVRSLLKQLSFYTHVELNPQDEETTLSNCIYRLCRQTKNKKNQFLYFVFDGFACIPPEYLDSIKITLAPLFSIENARFLFSGNKEDIEPLLPDTTTAKQSNEMLKFQPNDVEGYLLKMIPDLSQDDVETIYKLSRKGLARQLAILMEKLQTMGIKKIEDYYREGIEDFYAEDFNWIEEQKDDNLTLLLALLSFSELPLSRLAVMRTLKQTKEQTNKLLDLCGSYVEEENGLITLRSDDFRKYLRMKLARLKTDIELLLIDFIEKSDDIEEKFVYLPALYKHVKDRQSLVNYLTSTNVQHYLEQKKSQAALNEQCEYGYNACNDFETQAAAYFRFAINRSVSREIEKNELSDAEIEALIAVGDDEKAFALTQNVFLLEERLKCLLIIAQAGKHLGEAMSEEIDSQISALIDVIDFEHIPDKALELAKLMMPVKMEKALEIIDKVAKVTKDRQQIDRLYTAISIFYNNEGKNNESNATNADIVSTKIADDGLRKMASVMKSIMKESTSAQVVAKMKELPTTSSQLFFLSFWIPAHKKQEDIGDAVEYAVKLIIDTSTTSMPKVSFLRQFCKPLPEMKEEQVKSVVGMLDAVVANIKYPTIEYIKLMILVISAVVKYNKVDAENRLQTLYFDIIDMKDKALQAHCKALLLHDYDKLGDVNDVENWLMPSFALQEEITKDLTETLANTAYHLKVVEGPIIALVCTAPSFIQDVIKKINTDERRSRAYLLAATEYVRQTDVEKLNWEYFIKLFSKITYDKSELYRPLIELLDKIIDSNNKDTNLLNKVVKHYDLFKKVEQADAQCYIFSSLYVWLSQNYTDSDFQQKVKVDMELAWNKINYPWLKVITGYEMAKVLSKISMKTEAHEYVRKATDIRKNLLLSSSSCIAAYSESQGLYTHSLGVLIRSKMCLEKDLEQFKNLMDYDDSEGESIIMWARIALEYYGVNDINQFNTILNKYVSKPLDKFSIYEQKRILYNISPALYLSSQLMFYDRLKGYDTCFVNACIENIARYIQTKYPYTEYTSTKEIDAQIPLEKKDYDLLLDLMEHTQDEGFILNYTDIITQSIHRDMGRSVSREIQQVVLRGLEDIVKKRLPLKGGIQHNGYRIACMAIINSCKSGGKIKVTELKAEIEAIPNKADQAFLYAHVAPYLSKSSEKSEFIELAIRKTEEIDYTFDKFNRFNICLQEALTATPSKKQTIAMKVMESMKANNNGSYSDYQRLLDLVRDYDEQLADTMLEMIDDDPARLQYKKRLKLRMATSKKIEAARTDLLQVTRLNNDEQIRFFGRQMECLIKKKNIIRDFNATQSVVTKIYENPITDTQNAVLFFMENLFERNLLNGKYRMLLQEMHMAIIDNLKLVLAIASGTKEKLDRVNRIMAEKNDENDTIIHVGQADKGVKKLVDWYKNNQLDILRIIDPHFHGEDLFIIKLFMDINNNLKCFILTNNEEKDSLNDVFQSGWNLVSAELPGRIEIKSCCYEDQPEKAPFHDRWWILYDIDKDKYQGIRMASPSTFGSKITEISNMSDEAISSAMKVFDRFFLNMVPKNEERKLKYEETRLR